MIRLTSIAGVMGFPLLLRPGKDLAAPLTTAARGAYWEGLGTNIPLIAQNVFSAERYWRNDDSLLQ